MPAKSLSQALRDDSRRICGMRVAWGRVRLGPQEQLEALVRCKELRGEALHVAHDAEVADDQPPRKAQRSLSTTSTTASRGKGSRQREWTPPRRHLRSRRAVAAHIPSSRCTPERLEIGVPGAPTVCEEGLANRLACLAGSHAGPAPLGSRGRVLCYDRGPRLSPSSPSARLGRPDPSTASGTRRPIARTKAHRVVTAGAGLVDVRSSDAFAQGHDDGARNIPGSERGIRLQPRHRAVAPPRALPRTSPKRSSRPSHRGRDRPA